MPSVRHTQTQVQANRVFKVWFYLLRGLQEEVRYINA